MATKYITVRRLGHSMGDCQCFFCSPRNAWATEKTLTISQYFYEELELYIPAVGNNMTKFDVRQKRFTYSLGTTTIKGF
jgi:hypothetical protein